MSATTASQENQTPGTAVLDEKVAALKVTDANTSASTSQSPSLNDSTKAQTAPADVSSAPQGPRKTNFDAPLPDCHPPTQPTLTAEQETKYAELLALVSTWTEVPATSARNAAKDPLTDDDRLWLTRECLLRYLRATSWTTPAAAAKRITETLTWRREYGLAKFTPEYISVENETGKQVIMGYDRAARPCLYMFPSRQNTPKTNRQLHHLVFMLERCIELMPPGQEMVTLLISFKDMSSGQGASVGQGKETLRILQGHYPERLGRSLVSELPWYITTFFKIISPFIDPVTKEKMKFNERLVDYVPPEQLLKSSGGEVEFEYVHDVYWTALNEECGKRRDRYRQRWVDAGKRIGESELYLRGGTDTPAPAPAQAVLDTEAQVKA